MDQRPGRRRHHRARPRGGALRVRSFMPPDPHIPGRGKAAPLLRRGPHSRTGSGLGSVGRHRLGQGVPPGRGPPRSIGKSGLSLRRRPVDQLRRGGLAESAARLNLRLRGGPLRCRTFVPPDPHIPGRGKAAPLLRRGLHSRTGSGFGSVGRPCLGRGVLSVCTPPRSIGGSGLPLRRRPVDQLCRGGLAESAARLDLRLRGGPLRRHTFVPPDPHIPGRGRKPPASRLWPGGTAV